MANRKARARQALTAIGSVAVAAAAALFGVELLDYHRFAGALDHHVEASQADGGAWPPLHETCFACHGPRGRSANGHYPALAGQPAAYIEAQLQAFASGQRHSPTMGPLARSLSEADVKRIAAYYAAQTPDGGGDAPRSVPIAQQEGLMAQASSCRACHGETLGGKGLAPRLAGQGQAYLADQLAAFKTGARHDASGAMNGVAAGLTDEDIPALARHLATLSPAHGSR